MLKGLAQNTEKNYYSNLDSALRPVPYDSSMPAPLTAEDGLGSLADEVIFDEDSSSAPNDPADSEYESEENLKLILFSLE